VIERNKQEKDERKAQKKRAKEEKDRRAAERSASKSIASGSTGSATRSQPHEQSLVGGSNQNRRQERTVEQASASQGEASQDTRKNPASTTLKHSGTAAAETEDMGPIKLGEDRGRQDDSPANRIGSSTAKTVSTSEPAFDSQSGPQRDEQCHSSSTQQPSLPLALPCNRSNLNINASDSGTTGLAMSSAYLRPRSIFAGPRRSEQRNPTLPSPLITMTNLPSPNPEGQSPNSPSAHRAPRYVLPLTHFNTAGRFNLVAISKSSHAGQEDSHASGLAFISKLDWILKGVISVSRVV
jgi:hypothetical protein